MPSSGIYLQQTQTLHQALMALGAAQGHVVVRCPGLVGFQAQSETTPAGQGKLSQPTPGKGTWSRGVWAVTYS